MSAAKLYRKYWFSGRLSGVALLLYGLSNAILTSSLLPLWEGFDETFHYAFVQSFSTSGRFPVLGLAPVSEEVWQALQFAPVSHYIQPSTKARITFTEYFRATPETRLALRAALDRIPSDAKYRPHWALQNYEVNQSPLPYILMAPVDWLLSGASITVRVFTLRLLISCASVLLLFKGMRRLAALLDMPLAYALAAEFCVFSAQMLYATICHVCNDWLAIPAMVLLICGAIEFRRRPSERAAAVLALLLSLALLTKAYFLIFAPFALLLVAWEAFRRRASYRGLAVFAGIAALLNGPWYARNLALYHNLSGTVESTSGVGLRQIVESLAALPWGQSIRYMALSSLWTGNNSFTTFSARTLSAMLILLLVSFVLYALYRGKNSTDGIVIAAILIFCGALLLVTAAFFYSTKHQAIGAVPWYSQVLLAPVLLLAFAGLGAKPRWGRWIAATQVALWCYVLGATYLVKLIPQYGGYPEPKVRMVTLYHWWVLEGARRHGILTALCPASPGWIYMLTCLTVALSVMLLALSVRLLFTHNADNAA